MLSAMKRWSRRFAPGGLTALTVNAIRFGLFMALVTGLAYQAGFNRGTKTQALADESPLTTLQVQRDEAQYLLRSTQGSLDLRDVQVGRQQEHIKLDAFYFNALRDACYLPRGTHGH